MGDPAIVRASARNVTTRRFALSGSEWTTTTLAAVVSTTGYLTAGFPYLARGVLGDLAALAALAAVGTVARARVKHEAVVCLAGIGLVLVAEPGWPLRLPEAAWWGVFFLGLAAYVAVRHRLCDGEGTS